MVHLLLWMRQHTSYPCSLGLMGSTSHLANELGKVDRDHSTTMDASCTFVLPMSRMHGVQQRDLGSSLIGVLPLVMWIDFCQLRVARFYDSLSIDSSSLSISLFSRVEMRCRDGT